MERQKGKGDYELKELAEGLGMLRFSTNGTGEKAVLFPGNTMR